VSRPRKVTHEQIIVVRASQEERRMLLEKLRALPTLRQYAREWKCTERLLWALLQSS
jgi:hypothetical protein